MFIHSWSRVERAQGAGRCCRRSRRGSPSYDLILPFDCIPNSGPWFGLIRSEDSLCLSGAHAAVRIALRGASVSHLVPLGKRVPPTSGGRTVRTSDSPASGERVRGRPVSCHSLRSVRKPVESSPLGISPPWVRGMIEM